MVALVQLMWAWQCRACTGPAVVVEQRYKIAMIGGTAIDCHAIRLLLNAKQGAGRQRLNRHH